VFLNKFGKMAPIFIGNLILNELHFKKEKKNNQTNFFQNKKN